MEEMASRLGYGTMEVMASRLVRGTMESGPSQKVDKRSSRVCMSARFFFLGLLKFVDFQ